MSHIALLPPRFIDSLRSVVRLWRESGVSSPKAVNTVIHTESGDKAGKNMSKSKAPEEASTAGVFSIGLRPRRSITQKSTLKSEVAKPDRTHKDTSRFPLKPPSCASHLTPAATGYLSAFLPREAWRFLIAHAVGIWPGVGRSPKLGCAHEPPFSPTTAPYPVTIVLSPTR